MKSTKKSKIKHGDIVSCMSTSDPGSLANGVKRRVFCVALYVDIQKNPGFMGGEKSGLYLFRGQWYGNNKLNSRSYGKCYGMVSEGWYKPMYRVGHANNWTTNLN